MRGPLVPGERCLVGGRGVVRRMGRGCASVPRGKGPWWRSWVVDWMGVRVAESPSLFSVSWVGDRGNVTTIDEGCCQCCHIQSSLTCCVTWTVSNPRHECLLSSDSDFPSTTRRPWVVFSHRDHSFAFTQQWPMTRLRSAPPELRRLEARWDRGMCRE